VSATASDGQARSATANGQAVSASVFDPCLVSPHPKAGERKTKGSRKRRHSAILTDTPEKRALEEERKKRKSKLGTRGTRATVSRKAAQNTRIVKEKKGKIKKTATKASVYCSSDEDTGFVLYVESLLVMRGRRKTKNGSSVLSAISALIWYALMEIHIMFVKTVIQTEDRLNVQNVKALQLTPCYVTTNPNAG